MFRCVTYEGRAGIIYTADACASGRPIHYTATVFHAQCPRRPISVDVNMTQILLGRRPILPIYDGLLINTYVKRQRDSGRSPYFLRLTLPFLSQNSPFSPVFSSITAMD